LTKSIKSIKIKEKDLGVIVDSINFLKIKIKNFLTRLALKILDLVNSSAKEHNSLENADDFYENEISREKYRRMQEPFYNEIFNYCKKNSIFDGKKLIGDAGCGTGELLGLLCQKNIGEKWIGYDFSHSAISFAQKTHMDCRFFQDDLYDIKNREKFDLLFCTEVLEHLLYPDKVLKNIYDLLNDNGILLVTVPNGRIDNFQGHINFWSKESFLVFLASVLGINDIEYFELQGGRKLGALIKK